jgi:hypothetical protein
VFYSGAKFTVRTDQEMAQSNPVPELDSTLLAEPPDARVWPRFSAPLGTSCRLTTVTDRKTFTADIINVSQGGLRLTADRLLERGTCVMAELRSRSGLFVRVLLMHIIHTSVDDEGRCEMGGEFLDPMSVEEIRLFLN